MTHAAAGAVGVIGGTGFIGRRLVAHLAAEGTPVVVITPEAPAAALPAGARWISADVRDATTLTAAMAGLPVVYNLAGAHGLESQPRAVFEALNVAAAHQVADAAARAGVRHLVFTSTARVYGNAVRPAEDAACRPTNDYAITKLAAERIYAAWRDADAGRRLSIVRPAVVIGPGAHATGGSFLRMIAAPGYALPGAGREHKAIAYVDNLAAFLAFLRVHDASDGIFNYADQPDLELHEIVEIVRTAVGVRPATRRHWAVDWARATWRTIARLSAAGETAVGTTERRFDVGRAYATGFLAPIGLREALAATAREELGWMRILDRQRA